MPIKNTAGSTGPVPSSILHPHSMNVTESWSVVKSGTPGPEAFNFQAQLAITAKGTWLCCWTQGTTEGHFDQRVVCARSIDAGRTWSKEICIEPAGPDYRVPAWVIAFTVPHTGRVYMFYWWNHSGELLRDAGDIYFRFSDDDGLTWSDRRCIGVPRTTIDEPGADMHGWNFGQPRFLAATGQVLFTFTKMRRSGIFPDGWTLPPRGPWEKTGDAVPDQPVDQLLQGGSPNNWETEVFFCDCENILTEENPDKLRFKFLPEGNEGLWVPYPGADRHFGQEGTVVSLSGGRLLCVLRTRQGHPFFSVSADRGKTWTKPEILRACPHGEPLANPCSACPIHRLSDGRIVFLFHNVDPDDWGWYPRDPLWVTVAREIPGLQENAGLVFCVPKVILYNDRVPEGPFNNTEISYPQFYEVAGKYYIVYSNKTYEIRINQVPPELIDDHGLGM